MSKNADDEEAIFRVDYNSKEPFNMKEVVDVEQAKQIIKKMHQPRENECLPLGINKLMYLFQQRYTIHC